jgi:hypothetical protein
MLAFILGILGFGSMAAAAGGGRSKDAIIKAVVKAKEQAEEAAPEAPEVVDPEPEAPEVVVDPTPEPAPVVIPEPEAPEVVVTIPEAPEQPSGGPEPTPTPAGVTLDASFNASAVSGRVTTLELPEGDISSVKVISGPQYGNVTVNPDNTLAVVLSGTTETANINFTIETTSSTGAVTNHEVNLDVSAGPQAGGWGLGEFYMLEADENDEIIVEHGENHRVVHISGSDDALTLADIAAIEGLDVSAITNNFLRDNLEYGASPEMALDEEAGERLWKTITNKDSGPSSNWLLFDRGYEYDNLGSLLKSEVEGESALNPIYIGAYGEGDTPVVNAGSTLIKTGAEHLVIQGIAITESFAPLVGKNILLDNVALSGEQTNVQNIEGFTLRNSSIIDVIKQAPSDPAGWRGLPDRESGIFISKSEGILIENTFFDHNGWGEGYDPAGDPNLPQPPSMYSQNVYLQGDNLDVTFRDNISMRAAANGVQVRSGGFLEDNVFLDNNIGFLSASGEIKGVTDTGNYTLFSDNLTTSAGYREADQGQGAISAGGAISGKLATALDNIVTHLADPNNSSEILEKTITNRSFKLFETEFYNDTIVYNWGDKDDENTDGLDYATLDQTTIQIFTAQLLGQETATIADLADYLRAQADGQLDHVVDADLIIEFFQTGFGISPDIRGEAETLRFVPNDLGDGVRWDNRLNWTTEDLPGTQDGDSVDLAGNWVYYGGTTTIEDLDFGEGGMLHVTHGYLQVDDHIAVGEAGATLNIDNAGQFWTEGYTDQDVLTINADGGRFANTSLFTGTTDFNISDNAQAILASDGADFALNKDSTLTITGGDAKVGFDGDQGGTGVLMMADNSTLGFVAEDGELGVIREFYSGAFDGNGAGIQSGVNLGNADLFLDLTGIAGGGAVDETLIKVDEVIGNFDNIEIVGLGNNQNAYVTVDYEADTVTLSLGAAGQGSGKITLGTAGNEADAQDNADLWAALTNGHGIYPDDPVEDIPDEDDSGTDI